MGETELAPSGMDLASAALDSGTEAGRERLRLAVRNFGLAFFESDIACGTVLLTPSGFALFGLPVPRAPQAVDRTLFWSLYHPHDQPGARARFEADLAGRRGRDDYRERVRILRADDGRLRWIEFSGHMFGPPGARTHIVGLLRDVTEDMEAEERRALLAREVEHRAHNALAVVQALIRLTKGDTLEEYRRSLEGRILALARTQALAVAAGGGRAVPLDAVIEGELDAYRDHVEAALDDTPSLNPSCVQPVAMILHELATNAAKHGALSAPGGRIRIAAQEEGDDLILRWTEIDGPPVPTSPGRAGTGMGVVRAQARRLGGTLHYHWLPAGLDLELRVPLTRWLAG